jgi:hypothetical protein
VEVSTVWTNAAVSINNTGTASATTIGISVICSNGTTFYGTNNNTSYPTLSCTNNASGGLAGYFSGKVGIGTSVLTIGEVEAVSATTAIYGLGVTAGVWGKSITAAGYGLMGETTSVDGYGVFGLNSGGGYAAFFDGDAGIGTTSTHKIGFFDKGNDPVVQPDDAYGSKDVTNAGSTDIVYRDTTFTGFVGSSAYTIGDVVRALKNLGLIAS